MKVNKPQPADTVQLKREYDHLVEQRKGAGVDDTWEQIEKFIGPFGSGSAAADNGQSQQEWRLTEVWDTTAIEFSEKEAASLQSSVISPAIRWFQVKFRNKDLVRDREAADALEENSKRVWDALQASDFNSEMGSGLLDFVRYGNMFIILEAAHESVWEGFDFSCVPLREGYFVEDSRGRIVKFFRRLQMTAAQMVDKFGLDFVPEAIRSKVEQKSPEALDVKHEVVLCIFERKDAKKKARVLASEMRPVGSVYFLGSDGSKLGEKEGGYYEMPVFLGRFNRVVGSVWGHGPGHIALPTVKLLNALLEAELAALEKAVDPPLLVRDGGVLGGSAGRQVDQEPGGLTPVADTEDIVALESKARFDLADQKVFDMRGMIRRVFHGDELALKDSPEMSATEAQIRYELMNRLLGATLARLQSDVLDLIIHLAFNLMYRAEQLKPMPKQVVTLGGGLSIEYQGPLARSQRTDEVAAIERAFSLAAAALKMGFEEVRDWFDPGEALIAAFERLGTPPKLLRSKVDAEKSRKDRQAMQMQAMQAEIAKTQAEAASKSSSLPAAPPPMLTPTMGG